MLDDARAHEVEAHNVIAQIGAELGGDRFGDFDRRQLNATLSERMPGQRRGGDAVRVPAIEQRLDFAVARHAIGETHPAGAVAGTQHRTHQGKNAGGLDQQPRRAIGQVLPVQRRQFSFEIVVHQRDGQVSLALDDANAERGQRSAEFLGALHVDRLNAHGAFLQVFLGDLRRQAEACPVSGRLVGGRAGA